GPRMGEGDEDRRLRAAASSALAVAEAHELGSLAFPAISAGIFGFPIERSAEILIDVAVRHLEGATGTVREVTFCLWGGDARQVFEAALRARLG
ncbi:MAG: macro domain-containing protein, partial [Myxococcota bacterium]|nr:macro domain-containing protein [Myxococcota bacterium]